MSQLGQKRKSRPCGGMSALLRDTVAKGLLGVAIEIFQDH